MNAERRNNERFGPFFNIPSWRIEGTGKEIWKCDDLVYGRSLAHCTPREREQAVNILIRQYADFARHETQPPSPTLTAGAIENMIERAPDSIVGQMANRYYVELHTLGSSIPLLPAHGDLSAQNIFISGGKPWIIDWDTAGAYRPLLFDVLYLILREAELGRADLLDAFVSDSFDEALDLVFSSSGSAVPRPNNFILFLHNYIVYTHLLRVRGRNPVNTHFVDSLWTTLCLHCQKYILGPARVVY